MRAKKKYVDPRTKHRGVGKGNYPRPVKPEVMKEPIKRIAQKIAKREEEPDYVAPEEIKNDIGESHTHTQAEEVKAEPQAEEKPIEPQAETQSEVKEDFFSDLRKNYGEKPTGDKIDPLEAPQEAPQEEKPKEQPTESVKEEIKAEKIIPIAQTKTLISGYLFLIALNAIYPDVMIWVLSRINKKYRNIDLDGAEISLDETQLGMIEEIADEVVTQYLPKINPAILLFICMNAMYYQNMKDVIKAKPHKIKI